MCVCVDLRVSRAAAPRCNIVDHDTAALVYSSSSSRVTTTTAAAFGAAHPKNVPEVIALRCDDDDGGAGRVYSRDVANFLPKYTSRRRVVIGARACVCNATRTKRSYPVVAEGRARILCDLFLSRSLSLTISLSLSLSFSSILRGSSCVVPFVLPRSAASPYENG